MIGLMSVPLRADEIQIGSGSTTNKYLPIWFSYEYSYTQQIYTAAEIAASSGGPGTITSIAFFNVDNAVTRKIDLYLVNTTKESFSSNSDWIHVSTSNKVFSGQITLKKNEWTVIDFRSNPFDYTGGNLAVIINDNTGNSANEPRFLVFNSENSKKQSIGFGCDDDNIIPSNPGASDCWDEDHSTRSYKNQIKLEINMASCALPKNMVISDLSATSANLTWTAGGDEASWDVSYSNTPNNPNAGTIETVNTNTYNFSGLTPQTSYYAYVRANCSSTEHSEWSGPVMFNTIQTPVTVDAQHPFDDSFEGNECGWLLENGNLTNQWHWGTATNNGGTKSIYVSNDGGMTNAYTYSQATNVYATKTFSCEQDGIYQFSYDWHAKGDSYGAYDWMRVALVPATVEFTASSTAPSGLTANEFPTTWQAIALDGGAMLYNSVNWQNKAVEVELTAGTYKMVFIWRNNTYYQNQEKQPPAAIDNVHISVVSCAQPTELTVTAQARTATVTWNAGSDSQWQVAYGTVSGEPDANTIQTVTAATCSFSGLTPETDYYAFVRTVCDENEYSEWSEQSFSTTEACPAPTNLNYSNVGPYTATVSWTAGASGQTAWNLQYKKHSDSQWSESIEVYDATTYQLTGLSAITSYDVQVQAVCDGEDGASEWLTRTNLFTTDCGAIDLPYECGFEGPNVSIQGCLLPKCWSVKPYTTNNNEKYPKVASSGSNAVARTGTYCLKFYKTSSISDEMAILPEINKDLSLVQLRFWARINSSSTNSPDLHIVVLNDPENTSNYTEVANVKVNSDVYTEYTIRLDNYSGNGRYLAILCKAGDTSLTSFFVDDLLVEEIPNCSVPQNLSANALSSFQTLITWGPGAYETQWQLEVTAEGGTPETVTVNSVPFHTLTTMSNTIYSVRVRSVCGSDFYSEWTEPITFRTPCDEINTVDAQHPFFEDFNGEAFPPDCWTINNEKYNGSTGSGWFRSVNNNMDNHGVAVSYWYGNTYLIMPRMHISGDAKISFDQYFMANDDPIASRVVISTDGMSYSNFTEIWSASEAPTSVTNVTIPLPAAYQDRDVYIAFKFGNNDETERDLSQQYREWFIDNVEVYVGDIQRVELTQGWNWWSPTVETSLEQLEVALGVNGISINSQNQFALYDEEDGEWSGNLSAVIPGQMYKINANTNCNFILTGISLTSVTIGITHGNNWFGYIGSDVVTVEEAFSGFTPSEGDKITSEDGKFTIYEDEEWDGNLLNLEPGRGYIYVSQDTETKQFTFTRNY